MEKVIKSNIDNFEGRNISAISEEQTVPVTDNDETTPDNSKDDAKTDSDNKFDPKESESNFVDSTTNSPNEEKFKSNDEKQLEKEIKQLKLCLEEKEKQLETAAKYGITLLQNNETLQALLDKKEDDVRNRIEEVEDEKHLLKMQMDSERLEHESVSQESKNDLAALKACMEVERRQFKGLEKGLNDKINHLSLTTENLTDQILNASLQEEESMSQVSSLRLQVSETEVEQENHIRNLQNELSDLRVEMERMLRLKTEECRLLNTALDQSQERLVSMEKERISETIRAEQLQMELMRLEDKYVVLLSKVESNDQSDEERGGANFNEMSLFAELDVLSDAVHAHELINGRNSISGKSSLGTQLRQEILEVYRQVQRLIMEVKGQGHLWSPEVVDINDLKAGQLLFSLTQLHQLLNRRFHTDSLPPLSDEQSRLEGQVSSMKDQAVTLKEQLSCNQKTLDRVKEELTVRDQQLQRSQDHKAALEGMVKESLEEVDSTQRKMDKLMGAGGSCDGVQLVSLLRTERDHAVKKSRDYELELTGLRLDLKDMDRQLLESVEQKLQLSNQLEAWQNDMHELIENKMAGEIERDSLRSTLKPRLSLSSSSSSSSNPVRPTSFKKRFSLKWS